MKKASTLSRLRVKRELLAVLSQTVATDGTTGPLMVSLERFVASHVRCCKGEGGRLSIPVAAPTGK